MPPPQRLRNIVILGFKAVGKSTVTGQFVEGVFTEEYLPTIENTLHKNIAFQGEVFKTKIIDSNGQDEFSIFPSHYMVGIDGYILVYTVTDSYSFEMVQVINDRILSGLGRTKVPRVLVGNKRDLALQRKITEDQGKALANKWGCAFVETSAKRNENIDSVFLLLINEIKKQSFEQGKPNDGKCILL
eukprot:TRINITY_DN3098_c0_g1_i1.p1 TRINITY_DN3098_c0_g1~~TRINITY_DN3098_c0_g1_i1.p1  ORF type:complete len:194 (-),score=34.02 TRINITY_DN3098_c0_g1_i1:123-683(-)